jgi:hypothetical protein
VIAASSSSSGWRAGNGNPKRLLPEGPATGAGEMSEAISGSKLFFFRSPAAGHTLAENGGGDNKQQSWEGADVGDKVDFWRSALFSTSRVLRFFNIDSRT